MIVGFESQRQGSKLVRIVAALAIGAGITYTLDLHLSRVERMHQHAALLQNISAAQSVSAYNMALRTFALGKDFFRYFPEQDPDHFYHTFALCSAEDSIEGTVEGWVGLAVQSGVEVLDVIARKRKEVDGLCKDYK